MEEPSQFDKLGVCLTDMCGINGIYAFQAAAHLPRQAELLATREYMRTRGPDGAGIWWSQDRRCGFGHRRLSIIDLSERASQPMASADGRLAVVFNGEIYNFPQIKTDLESAGVRFRTTSDTEALLYLYERDGADMVHALRGMYAFAIWDGEKHALLLARDPYGIKPLYTANDSRTFRFASQVKALLAGGEVSRDPEPAGLVGFHLFGSVPEPFTLYRRIRALPAGHTQWVDEAGPRDPEPFANLADVLAKGTWAPAPSSELGARVRAAVLDSVRAHLLADVEVGIFLSAGIDSCALLGLMRDAGQRKIRAITLGFDEYVNTAEDEVPLASEVARQYSAEHIIRRVSRREFEDDLPRIFDAMDQPSIDGVNTWFVSKAAKEAGLKVALSGLGGDELLAGYPSFRDIPIWRHRYGAIASVPFLGNAARLFAQAMLPGFARQHPKAIRMFQYAGSWAGTYMLRRGVFLPDELQALLDRDSLREGMLRLRPLSVIGAQMSPDPCSAAGRVCLLESSNYMRNQLLRDADWSGMAHGLEIRVPLVDWYLTSFLAPDIASLVPGDGKAALACAPSLPLPEVVRCRSKTGFSVPTRDWIAPRHPSQAIAAMPLPPSMGQVSRWWLRRVYAAIVLPQIGHPMPPHDLL